MLSTVCSGAGEGSIGWDMSMGSDGEASDGAPGAEEEASGPTWSLAISFSLKGPSATQSPLPTGPSSAQKQNWFFQPPAENVDPLTQVSAEGIETQHQVPCPEHQ